MYSYFWLLSRSFSFIFGFQHCVRDLSRYGFLWACLTWASLSFLNLIWEVFSHYFFKYFLYSHLFSSFWRSDNTNARSFAVLPHESVGLCSFFFPIFFLSVSTVDNFYWFISKFTDSFPFYLHSDVKSLSIDCFYFRCCIFQFKNFQFFIVFISLLRTLFPLMVACLTLLHRTQS